MKNKIIDLFCGAGGLSLGFEQAGFETILAIDKWEDAIKTYNNNFSGMVGRNIDIESLTEEELLKYKGKVAGVIGGPPCQGFSTVGTRDIHDSRNHLYLEYCRVVSVVQPEFFLIENVKGLLTLGGGFFKRDIIERFTKLGYKVTYQILNASDYGVPQNRERVFFVGIKDREFKFPSKKDVKISTSEAIGDLSSLENGEPAEYISEPQNNYQKLMRGDCETPLNHEETKHIQRTIDIISMVPDGGNIKDLPEKYWNVRKYNKAFERMNSKLPSNTIDTGHRNYFHYKYNRVPSVRESARIQSFPDSFNFLGSKTSQYEQVGNAVPPKLSELIANEIKKVMED